MAVAKKKPPGRRRDESNLRDEILRLWGARPDLMLWRNNVGVGRGLSNAQSIIKFGLVGSADIMGVWRRTHTIKTVTNPNSFTPYEREFTATHGHALAIETKTKKGRLTVEQCRFQVAWEAAGGVYILARELEDVSDVLGGPHK